MRRSWQSVLVALSLVGAVPLSLSAQSAAEISFVTTGGQIRVRTQPSADR